MGKFLKVYGWLSGIVIAFVASYLTAVLTAIVPAPKDLLCKFSLGFCPAPKVISFGATDIDRIVDRDGVGQGIGQHQIGMLHNQVENNQRRPNMVKYRVVTDVQGEYKLRILYAAGDARPIELHLNDAVVERDALSSPTGGWDNKDRRWSTEYRVRLANGENFLLLKRADVFPHLSKIEFSKVR